MDVRNFEYMLMIAKEGTILGAAEQLHISQSALSQALAKEESDAGGRLFERARGKKVTVTKLGELYLRTAENMVRIKNETYAAIDRLSHNTSETVRIAICNQAYASLSDRIIDMMKRSFPHLNIYFYRTDSLNSIELLKNGSVDLSILAARQIRDSVIETASLYKEHLVLAVSEEYARDGSVLTEKQLENIPFIYPARNTFLNTLIPKEMQEDRVRHPKVYKSSDAEEIIKLVENGYGAAFVPSSLIPEDHSCFLQEWKTPLQYEIFAAIPKYSRNKENLSEIFGELAHIRG